MGGAPGFVAEGFGRLGQRGRCGGSFASLRMTGLGAVTVAVPLIAMMLR